MSRKYKFRNPTAAYFISFATVYWMDIFTRPYYFSLLESAIAYCRASKGMEVQQCKELCSYGQSCGHR
ncbi:MAG: hypothetical protein P8O98_04795 [Flavobacteriaceae bacterium]|nr:hypothetical protein [Flavobacteriaceae bacterium]MDG1941024.1 hypothetical protein [Flavobacteriaceae bacterium]